jgi:hypothetical protein
MASHPYISGPGNITQMIGFLRKNFPATVTSDTVKKFQLASNNESYVINALQFIGLIDDKGKRTERGHKVLTIHDEEEFKSAFAELIRESYRDLFELRGEDAWQLPKGDLIGYFRSADKTSDVIGTRQAGVFQAFASLAGHGPAGAGAKQTPAKPRERIAARKPQRNPSRAAAHAIAAEPTAANSLLRREMALTVRIEINLPAEGSKETYDHIFKSIKENLLDE